MFLSHGATDGHDLDDWLQAEQELTAGLSETMNVCAVSA
jgi:hypothetical protein